jgi:hypothetical protein
VDKDNAKKGGTVEVSMGLGYNKMSSVELSAGVKDRLPSIILPGKLVPGQVVQFKLGDDHNVPNIVHVGLLNPHLP